MKNFFSIIVIFAILLVGGGWVYMKQSHEKAQQQAKEDLADARRNFANKARAAASEEDKEDYLRGIRAALTQYEEELDGRVFKENKEFRDAEAYKKTVEKHYTEGKIDEAQKKSMLEGYQLVADAYEVLKNKSWSPVLTQAGKGDTRVDIYTLTRAKTPDGAPVLEGNVFFWGIEDSTDVRWGELAVRLWHTVEKKRDEVEEVLGKQEGSADPILIIQNPANYVDEFPSFLSIGKIWLPVPPHQAEKMDLTYSYRTKTYGGGEVESTLEWEKMEIPSSWKLGENEVWDADEIEATEDEIAGVDPEEEEAEEGEDSE